MRGKWSQLMLMLFFLQSFRLLSGMVAAVGAVVVVVVVVDAAVVSPSLLRSSLLRPDAVAALSTSC